MRSLLWDLMSWITTGFSMELLPILKNDQQKELT